METGAVGFGMGSAIPKLTCVIGEKGGLQVPIALKGLAEESRSESCFPAVVRLQNADKMGLNPPMVCVPLGLFM